MLFILRSGITPCPLPTSAIRAFIIEMCGWKEMLKKSDYELSQLKKDFLRDFEQYQGIAHKYPQITAQKVVEIEHKKQLSESEKAEITAKQAEFFSKFKQLT